MIHTYTLTRCAICGAVTVVRLGDTNESIR